MKKLMFNNKVKIKVFDQFSPIANKKVTTEKDLDDFYKLLKKKLR